jgi:hypothetical protein
MKNFAIKQICLNYTYTVQGLTQSVLTNCFLPDVILDPELEAKYAVIQKISQN